MPLQHDLELLAFLGVVSKCSVHKYLEIGARYGETFESVMMAMPDGSSGLAIDLPGGNFGDPDSAEKLKAVCDRMWRRQAACILGASGRRDILDYAIMQGPYDLILIDGDHQYNAVKADWDNYARHGRIIALHDIAAPEGHASSKGIPVDVPRLWAEIKAVESRTLEIVAPGSKMGFGIVWRET